MDRMKAALAIDAKDIIGEGPVWDAASGRCIWSDNALGVIHEARQEPGGNWLETRRWSLGRPMGAAIPRPGGGFLVTSGTELIFLSPEGGTEVFARIDADPSAVQLNDAKCDRKGRLWVGTVSHDFTQRRGALYRIDAQGAVTTLLQGLTLANGLDWSADGRTFYLVDSYTRTVDAFDFDMELGEISRRRTIIAIPQGDGSPDGMTVDSDGYLWLAVLGRGEVRRYTPDGVQISCVEVPAPTVTSCAFGGNDGGELFMTSAALRIPDPLLPLIGYSPEQADSAAKAPGAGGLFVCRPGVAGCPATPFAR
jgi:sugar lactone lactonase YvrE